MARTADPTSKRGQLRAANALIVCPVCGKPVTLTATGVIRESWHEKYNHRDWRGEPCPGAIRQEQVEA